MFVSKSLTILPLCLVWNDQFFGIRNSHKQTTMRLPLIVEVQRWRLCVGIGVLMVACCGWQVSGVVCGKAANELNQENTMVGWHDHMRRILQFSQESVQQEGLTQHVEQGTSSHCSMVLNSL